jgi:3-phenylpropionate/cinnamic acid dioxygenase small subunit
MNRTQTIEDRTMSQTHMLEDHLLRLEIEDFLWMEADLLDEFRYEEWLELLTDDLSYWMPIRENVPSREMEGELSDPESGLSWYSDDKATLARRIGQIRTHFHWADEPFSRVSHIVSNVRILGWTGPDEVRVKCRFVFYRNRHADEESTFIGKRIDTLRRVDGEWKIARREIYLDESVMLFKNLTSFF